MGGWIFIYFDDSPQGARVTISSAAVGWMATQLSKSAFVAPIFTATPKPCRTSSEPIPSFLYMYVRKYVFINSNCKTVYMYALLTNHVQSDHLLIGPLADELILRDGLVAWAALIEAAVVEVDEIAAVHLDVLRAELLHRLRLGQANWNKPIYLA